MSLDFPNTPADGERSVQPNGVTYEWQDAKERWISITTLGGSVVGGTVVQVQNVQRTDSVVTTDVMDNTTLPQITEGVEVLSLPFTPKYANSIIQFDINVTVNNDTASRQANMALFDGAADAICAKAGPWLNFAGVYAACTMLFEASAGSVDPRTYTVRIGPASASELRMNGVGGTLMGGVNYSGITITEIQPNAIVEPILPSPLEIFINGEVQIPNGNAVADFPIPAGVKQITVSLRSVSVTDATQPVVRMGIASGIVTTGYESAICRVRDAVATSVTGFGTSFGISASAGASLTNTGNMLFTLQDAVLNKWSVSSNVVNSGDRLELGAGSINLGSGNLLTTLRITPLSGVGTFAGGTINIQYDNQGQEATILASASGIVQLVEVIDTTHRSTNTILPVGDDIAPTRTEGQELLTTMFTPKQVGSIIEVDLHYAQGAVNGANLLLNSTLFIDGETSASALGSGGFSAGNANISPGSQFKYRFTSPSLDPMEIMTRWGPSATGLTYLNGNFSNPVGGGTYRVTLTITEIAG